MSRITKVEDLREYMQHFQPEEAITDETIIWFNCWREAKVISEQYSLKDLASFLFRGQEPMDTIESVQGSLNTWYEDESSDDENDLNDLYLKCRVCDFYGNNEEHSKIAEQMSILENKIEEAQVDL